MIDNLTKRQLYEGATVVGCFVRSPDAGLADYVAAAGWNFIVFDGEHGLVSPSDVANLARACDVHGVTPIVRVASSDRGTVLRCLDGGAAGILFPSINSKVEAVEAVSEAMYAPQGRRGLAGNRSTDWRTDREATETVNDQMLMICQIESREAVDNVEDLCSVPGIDVLFIGPTDLSQSLGVPGELEHPSVVESIKHVADAVSASDKILGMFAGSPAAAEAALELGVRFIATSVEYLLRDPTNAYLATAKRRAESIRHS